MLLQHARVCCQILRTLRGAFCDQSNGRTRVEALTSLLLSEHHLRAAGRDMAVVSREFLSTRGALYLDADATAAGTWMDQRKAQKQSLLPSRREEVGLTVGYVLREIDRANRSEYRRKLRRTSRRWRQRHGEADGEVMSEGCREELSDDSTDHAHENGDEGQGSGTESKRSVWGDPDREGEGTGDLIARLALAAVVSTIDGLLNSNTGVDGQTYRREGVRSPPTGGGEPSGQEANPEAAMLEGVRRAGLPLLMVQSSEDALIGTPLPVILRDEVGLGCEACVVSRSTWLSLRQIALRWRPFLNLSPELGLNVASVLRNPGVRIRDNWDRILLCSFTSTRVPIEQVKGSSDACQDQTS